MAGLHAIEGPALVCLYYSSCVSTDTRMNERCLTGFSTQYYLAYYCMRTKPLASTIALLRLALKRRLLLRSTLFSRPLVVIRATSVFVSASLASASC